MKTIGLHTSFWVVCSAIIAIIYIPAIVQQGMFLDGVTYAAISKNLSNGIGTWWKPSYTATFNSEFYGHPPFFFILQSFFFALLGDSFIVERIFSFIMLLCTICGIIVVWREYTKPYNLQAYAWLPVLLWIIIPDIIWTFSNNLLETAISPLVLFSIYFFIKSIHSKTLLFIALGSICLWIAYGIKGPVALFPLSFFIIHSILFKQLTISKAIRNTIITFSFVCILFILLCLIEPRFVHSFTTYHSIQVFAALRGNNEITVSWRGAILVNLFISLLPLFVITIVFLFIQKIRTKQIVKKRTHNQVFLFFILLFVSGSLPLVITLKQRIFYAVPSYSFITIACALLLVHSIPTLSVKSRHITAIIGIIGVCFGICFTIYTNNTYKKDAVLLQDIATIHTHIPPHTIIGCTQELARNWKLLAYLQRFASISITDTRKDLPYIIVEKHKDFQNSEYKPYILLQTLNVYKK